jgi:hypothetical protein
MLQACFDEGLDETAMFEFFVRKVPRNRNFLMSAGLAQVLDHLDALHFTQDDLDWLASTRQFKPAFLIYLGMLRFRGDVLGHIQFRSSAAAIWMRARSSDCWQRARQSMASAWVLGSIHPLMHRISTARTSWWSALDARGASVGRQSHVARSQTGVSPLRNGWPHGRRW